MDDLEREWARLTAQVDQAKANAGGLAVLLGAFMRDLLTAGLERSEALELTRDWFSRMLDAAFEQEA